MSLGFWLKTTINTLPKAQRTQRIENFDSFNTFSSKQKLQQSLESWSYLSLLFLAKGEKNIKLWQIHFRYPYGCKFWAKSWMSYLKKSQYSSQKIWLWKDSQSRSQKNLSRKKVTVSVLKIFGLKKSFVWFPPSKQANIFRCAITSWIHVEESATNVLEILLNLRHIFRVCSEYVQSMFRVFSEYVQSMFKVCLEYVQS